jgi:hypothetical protein
VIFEEPGDSHATRPRRRYKTGHSQQAAVSLLAEACNLLSLLIYVLRTPHTHR